MEGWISLHRRIQQNWVWEDKPFSRGQAWIDLLLEVNHEDKKVLFEGKLIDVKRGSKITSIRKLADRWGWSIHKTSDFLRVLEVERMLSQKRDTQMTLVTITNWALYQSELTKKEHSRDTEGTLKETNNNDNNDNNSSSSRERVAEIYKFFQNNIGLITSFQSQEIDSYLDDGFEPELIIEAMKDSLGSSNKWKYLQSILKNCNDQNIKTVDQYTAKKIEKQNAIQQKKPQGKPQNKFRPSYDQEQTERIFEQLKKEGIEFDEG